MNLTKPFGRLTAGAQIMVFITILPSFALCSVAVSPFANDMAENTATTSTGGTGTCSSTSECVSGCCSSSGFCGFGPNYCGDTCISTCNATAQCGQYAAVKGATCPLNVCCSQYGFCGTTSDFCGTGCQNGCKTPVQPSCSTTGGSATQRLIGYYESWSSQRPCDAWYPNNIDATKWTHLNYAFALIDPATFKIAQMNENDIQLYPKFTGLKSQNPKLKTYISVGGWAAGGKIFSTMTSTSANRAAFIASLKTFMITYGFDGVDIDWEYPVAGDRGGAKADKENYVSLVKELRSALGTSFGITVTLPSSYWYMQNFDVVNMEPYIDWFNLMSYDIHGTWDGDSPYTQAVVQPHTNLTEIRESLDLLWRNSIQPSKVVMGLAFYGRSFTLKSSSCKTPGCAFTGGGNPGKCTGTSGILSDYEIRNVISQYGLTPILDQEAGVKYMSWNNNQWVSYDDADTFKIKMAFANSLCLGGTMVWALDLDTVGQDTSIGDLLLLGGNNPSKINSVQMKTAVSQANAAAAGMFWTPCLPIDTLEPCPNGYSPIAWGHGKVFDADLGHLTGEGCHGGGPSGFQRALCANDAMKFGQLQWGPGARSKKCNSKCPKGWIMLSKNSHITGQKSGCKSGKYVALCASSIMTVSSSPWCPFNDASFLLSGGLSSQGDLTSFMGYDIQIKQDDGADSTNGPALEEREDPPTAEEEANEPGDTSVSPQDTEHHGLMKRSWGEPSPSCGAALQNGDIPIEIAAVRTANAVELNPHQFVYNFYWEPTGVIPYSSTPKPTSTTTEVVETRSYTTITRTCDGYSYPQACFHYSSVCNLAAGFQTITCVDDPVEDFNRKITATYNTQHNSGWINYVAEKYHLNNKVKPVNPQRDEWPPLKVWQNRGADPWIRLIPGGQNGGVANKGGSNWKGICKYPPDARIVTEGGPITDAGAYWVKTVYESRFVTLGVLHYTWTNVVPPAGDPLGLTANPAHPSVLTNDVGFALLTDDAWYNGAGRAINPVSAYAVAPPSSLTNGVKQPVFKRDLIEASGDWTSGPDAEFLVQAVYSKDDAVVVVDEGNSTRLATDEELLRLGFVPCQEPECRAEIGAIQHLQAESDGATTTLMTPKPTGPSTDNTAQAIGKYAETAVLLRAPGAEHLQNRRATPGLVLSHSQPPPTGRP